MIVLFIVAAFAAVWAGAFTERWPRRVLTAIAAVAGLVGIWTHSPVWIGEWFEALRWHSMVFVVALYLWILASRSTPEQEKIEVGGWRVLRLAVWGMAQQTLMLAFLLPEIGPVRAVAVFVAMHLPNLRLAAVTLIGGTCSVLIYQHAPSLIVPGIMHAALSGLLSALPDHFHGDMQIGPGYLDWRRSR